MLNTMADMRIVTRTPDRLEIEFRSWGASLGATVFFLFCATGIWLDTDPMLGQRIMGTVFVSVIALAALLIAETSRVAFDRPAGSVSLFRKRSFRTLRMTLPLRDLRGASVERVFYNGGWFRRVAFIFSDQSETWIIPASRGATRWSLAAVTWDINDWLGVDQAEVKDMARRVIGKRMTPREEALASLRRLGRRLGL